MSNLQERQEKIQVKRKQTSWRDFVRDICSWRNLTFYKSDGMVTRYPISDRIPNLVTHKDFENLESLNLEFDSTHFFQKISFLLLKNPLPPTILFSGTENSVYSDQTLASKNAYLSNVVITSEDVLYSYAIRQHSSTIIESISINSSSHIFHSRNVFNSSQIFYSSNIYESSFCWFCSNCVSCHNCIRCDGLEHKSYCIDNIQLSIEDYKIKMQTILDNKIEYEEGYMNILNYGLNQINCNNSIGYGIMNCNESFDVLFSHNIQYGKNIAFASFNDISENLYDICSVGSMSMNDCYGVMGCAGAEHIYCSVNVPFCNNTYYSYFLESCTFCLGCVGLKNKNYCIFNKQYTKEERYAKVDEVFGQMDRDGSLGEFFPASMNPFYFNDTAAYLIDPSFTKEEVTKLGYLRRDEPIKVDIPEGAITVKSDELGQFESIDEQGNWKLDETVCKRVILDENGDAYRIIPMELEFLQQHGLPLPRKHWLARMKENFRIS